MKFSHIFSNCGKKCYSLCPRRISIPEVRGYPDFRHRFGRDCRLLLRARPAEPDLVFAFGQPAQGQRKVRNRSRLCSSINRRKNRTRTFMQGEMTFGPSLHEGRPNALPSRMGRVCNVQAVAVPRQDVPAVALTTLNQLRFSWPGIER